MMKQWATWAGALLFALNLRAEPVGEAVCAEQFQAGNVAYEAGNFSDAVAAYEAVLGLCESFEAEYNCANANFKLGAIGASILHYERALQLRPNDGDARNNLKLANTKVVDRIEPLPTQGLRDVWERVVAKGRRRFWGGTLLAFWWVGFGALSFRLFAREVGMRRIAATLASVFLALAVGVGFLYSATSHREDASHEAVIVARSVEVRNAPQASNSLVLFILHEGTKGRILSRAGDWMELELANGSIGWVAAGEVAEI